MHSAGNGAAEGVVLVGREPRRVLGGLSGGGLVRDAGGEVAGAADQEGARLCRLEVGGTDVVSGPLHR